MGVEPMSGIRSIGLLRVQSAIELFPFPHCPLTGVGSGSFISLMSQSRLKASAEGHPL